MSDGCARCEPGDESRPSSAAGTTVGTPGGGEAGAWRVALLGNPNTGKTTLFNRLCGLRHKTGNFPGTTQEARVGTLRASPGPGEVPVEIHLIDLPGVYSLELEQSESAVCREVLAGNLAPRGEATGAPDAVCVIVDATNLARNLLLAGEVLARRLPTVVALNMIDLARRAGIVIDPVELSRQLGCPVVECCARSGEGVEPLARAMLAARVPNRTPTGPRDGNRDALEAWTDEVYALCVGHRSASVDGVGVDGVGVDAGRVGSGSAGSVGAGSAGAGSAPIARTPGRAAGVEAAPESRAPARTSERADLISLTDRLDRIFTHPVLGLLAFLVVMSGLLYVIFQLATYPMDWIDAVFAALADGVNGVMSEGILRDLLASGIVGGIGATVIFVPQIALLFFLISLLEDTGYLARASFLMDRFFRPFGLPGHSFVPLLSSHACALPGIMATRSIPDRRQRLLTILVAPFMTCSARLPVYVLVTTILFRDRPAMAALAFIGCYALGVIAGLLSAVVIGRTILPGRDRPMVLELPTYKPPSVRTALVTTWDRSIVFLKNAGTNILAISIVLWWLSSYPQVAPPDAAVQLRQSAAEMRDGRLADSSPHDSSNTTPAEASATAPFSAREQRAADLESQADRLEASHAAANSFAGRIGRFAQPIFAPLGYDWQLTIGVMTSFAAREVFASTMSVIVTGKQDEEDEGILAEIGAARRQNGTPVFTVATCWSLLVYYVLAMQCLPTLAVTAREAGGTKWALLQLAWMSGVAYIAALIVYQSLRAMGIA